MAELYKKAQSDHAQEELDTTEVIDKALPAAA